MWRTDSLEKPWCWERLKVGGEGDDRGWDGCIASLTQWAWVWASSGSWWWTGRAGMLQSMGLQIVEHDWVTELNSRNLGSFHYFSNHVQIWADVDARNAPAFLRLICLSVWNIAITLFFELLRSSSFIFWISWSSYSSIHSHSQYDPVTGNICNT